MGERARKWLRRTLIGVGTVLVLLPTIVVGVVQTGTFKDWLKSVAIEETEKALNARLEIDEIRGTLVGSLIIKGARLESLEGEPLVSIERLEADYELWGAISGEFEIDEIVVDGARVHLVRDEQGLNLARIVKPTDEDDTPPPDFRIALNDVRFVDGTVVWADLTRTSEVPDSRDEVPIASADAASSAYLSAVDIQARADLDLAGSFAARIDLKTDASVAGVASGPVAIENLAWRMDPSSAQNLSSERISVFEAAQITGVSFASTPGEEVMSWAAHSESVRIAKGINEILRNLELSFELARPIEATLDARGEGERLRARASIAARESGSIDLVATVESLASERPIWSVNARSKALEADQIVTGIEIPSHDLNMWVAGDGRGFEPKTLDANLRVGLERSRFTDYFIQQAYLEATAARGVIELETLYLDTPYLRGSASGSFDPIEETFSLRAEANSEDELARITGGKLSDDARLDGKLDARGRLDLDAEDPLGMLVSTELDARWDIANFSVEKIRIDRSTGRIRLDIDSLGAKERSVDFDLDILARRSRWGDYRLDFLDASGKGKTRIRLPIEDLGDVIRGADLDLDATLRGLDAPSVARVGESRIVARIDAKDTRTYQYDLETRLANVSIPSVLTTEKLDADLEGVVGLDSIGKRLTRLDARGKVDLSKTNAFDQSVGKAEIEIDVKGPTRNLDGSVKVNATDARVPQYDFATVTAKLDLLEERRFRLDVKGKPSSGTPRKIDLELRGSYSADLKTFEVDDVALTGAGESWIIENGLVAQTDDGTYRFRDLKLTHGDDQRVTLDGVFRPGRDQDLNLKIENLAIMELPREFGIEVPPIEGRIDGRVQLDGTSKKPRGYVELTLSELYYEGYGPFVITVRGNYDDERLYISESEVTAYGVRLVEATAIAPIRFTLDGDFEILEDQNFSVLATIVPFDLERFRDLLPVLSEFDARGQMAGEVAFYGRVNEPYMETQLNLRDAAVTAGLTSGENVEVGPVRVVSNLKYAPLSARQGGFRGTLSFRDRNNEGFRARASAEIPLETWLTLAARGEIDEIKAESWMNAPFEFLVLLPSYDVSKVNISSFKDARAEGSIDLYVQAGGTLLNPSGEIRGRLADFGWDRYRDIYVDLESKFGDDKLTIDTFEVNWDADDIIRASATLPVPIEDVLSGEKVEDLPLEANVELLELPIDKLSAVDYVFAAIAGTMRANINLDGKLSAPRLTGSVRLEDITFSDNRRGTLAVDFGARRDRVTANATLTHDETKSLTLSAGLPMNLNFVSLSQGEEILAKGPLSLSVFAADLPIASMIPRRILDRYAQKIRGTLNTDLSVRGTYEAPQISGEFNVAGFSAFFPGLGRTVDEGNLQVVARSNAIDIVELYAREGNGYMDADGEVVLENFKPATADLQIALKELSTSGFSPIPAYVTGNADVTADLRTEIIDTQVTLRDLDIAIPETSQAGTHPLELSPDIEILTPRERREGMVVLDEVESEVGARSQLARVQVKIAPNSWVHHPNADIQFRGDLALDVGQKDTVILGDISTVEGELEFLAKEFDIRQGIVTFAGNTPPNPRLQVEAVYELDRSITDAVGPATSGEPKAVVRVTGPARNPQLRLSSDPQMTESQIIFVLVTDRPPADPNEEQGVAGQAVAAASGLLSGLLKQRAAQYTPIDTFRLTTDSEGISGVELGRYFGKNLFFAYQYQFAAEQGENVNEFRIEYTLDFAPSWLVGTRFGDQGNGAVFIFWDVL